MTGYRASAKFTSKLFGAPFGAPILFSVLGNRMASCSYAYIYNYIYISLFGEDVEGLERSLMVLDEWCSRLGMKVNAEKSAIIHFRRKSCLQSGYEFSIGGEVIPVVAKYKYLGCVIDEFLDLNAMVDDRLRQVEGPWVPCFGEFSLLLGCCSAVLSRSC